MDLPDKERPVQRRANESRINMYGPFPITICFFALVFMMIIVLIALRGTVSVWIEAVSGLGLGVIGVVCFFLLEGSLAQLQKRATNLERRQLVESKQDDMNDQIEHLAGEIARINEESMDAFIITSQGIRDLSTSLEELERQFNSLVSNATDFSEQQIQFRMDLSDLHATVEHQYAKAMTEVSTQQTQVRLQLERLEANLQEQQHHLLARIENIENVIQQQQKHIASLAEHQQVEGQFNHLWRSQQEEISSLVAQLQEIRQTQQAVLEKFNRLMAQSKPVEAPSHQKLPKPAFRVIEPSDPSDLPNHPHIKLFPAGPHEANTLHFGWRIIGASRRGDGHAHNGKYREDDFAIRLFGQPESDAALVAIADGISSSEYSRRGARAAVLGATRGVDERSINGLVQSIHQNQEQVPEQLAWQILLQACNAAREAVDERASQDGLSLSDLQSTLLVFLAIPLANYGLFLASLQVGDGALYAFQPGEQSDEHPRYFWKILQKQQIQGDGNEVQPFTKSDVKTWQTYFDCRTRLPASFIMGMTDGTADDIQPPLPTQAVGDPDPFFFVHQFYRDIEKQALHRDDGASGLEEFLRYTLAQSRDDRTVVCLYSSK